MAKNYPAIIPADLNVPEFEKDVTLFSDLLDLKDHHNGYIEMIDDTALAVGSEAMQQADRVYDLAKNAAQRGNAAISEVVKELGRAFEGQGKRKTPPNP